MTLLPFSKALVTGGAGFIGSHIVDLLIQQGCEVTVLDDLSTGNIANLKKEISSSRSKNLLTFVKGDINDDRVVKKVLRDIEVVFHEASLVGVSACSSAPKLTSQVNVKGTTNMLKLSSESGVRKFIFASSAAVYGNCRDSLVSEDVSPTVPISLYGRSKLKAESLCLDYFRATGLDVTILRYFNAYGPRSIQGTDATVVNKFMEKLVRREAPLITGTGESTRDFVYVKDIANANLLAGSNKNSAGKIYNVASGETTTMNELASLELELLLGKDLIIPFDYKPRQREDVVYSSADVSKIQRDLGFKAKYSLREGLTEYFLTLFPSLPIKWQQPATLLVSN
jgi:nucleoside-diphosphate-sugar epimerase